MTNEEIIAKIFYMGITMSNSIKAKKKDEKELLSLCKKLEKSGVIEDAAKLYQKMCE